MTDQELKEHIAETGRHIRSLADRTDQQIRELRAGQAETSEQIRELQAETSENIRELRASQKRTDKQLGELGNRFGGFTEGMAMPSVREILYERFGVDTVVTDARARRNGHSLQIDAVGITNGGANEVYLVEIKSRLREESLQQILKHLGSFASFFPDHRGKTLYGILAAVDVPDELEKRILSQGIYLAKIHGDLFELVTPEGFQPRGFAS